MPDNVQVSSTTQHDVEPAIISTTIAARVYTATVFARAESTYRLWYTRRDDADQSILGGPLPVSPTYQSYGDPLLVGNTFGGGISPGRIYNVGIMHNGLGGLNSGVGCWYSDDGGLSWSGPVVVANEPSGGIFLDKPAAAVSSTWTSMGTLYVIYSRIVLNPPVSYGLYVAKSVNGGLSFSSAILVDSGNAGGHQIAVEPWTGRAIALWVDYDTQQIKMSQSADLGTTWSLPTVVTTGNFIVGYTHDLIRFNTILMTNYNYITGRLGLAWHESDLSGGSDAYYTMRETNGTWRPKTLINDVLTGDQFMPSLAFDGSGKGLIAFYDRRNDPSNTEYKLYGVTMNATDTITSSNFPMSAFASSATNYPQHFIGDYHQTFSWEYPTGGHWVSAFVGNQVTLADNADIWAAYTH